MSSQYNQLNDTNINVQKAVNLLNDITDKRKDSLYSTTLQSLSSLFSELYSSFKEFFTTLGKPTIQNRLQKIGSPPRSEDYNKTMKELYNDITLGYTEVDSLASIVVKDFNYSEAERQMLLNKVKKLNSDVTDYGLLSGASKTQTLSAGDTFSDLSKIDTTALTTGYSKAEISTSQGVITLKRTGNTNRASLVQKVINVSTVPGDWNHETSTGTYEGLFWARKSNARPEGGSWHTEVSSDGSKLYEMGAEESDLNSTRMNMFDSNADTFWEVESVTDTVTGYKNVSTGDQISVAEFNELFSNQVTSTVVETSGGTIVTSNYGSLIENYIPITSTGSAAYLEVSFTIKLSRAVTINWIGLNPNNFGFEDYIQVLSIQTSADGSTFEELSGFSNYSYSTTLTSSVNSELTEEMEGETLSTDAYKYAGQGIWTFAPRNVSSIMFRIRQPQAYTQEYDVLMVQTTQTITTTTTSSAWFGLFEDEETSTQTVTREYEIPYLTGQISGFDVLSLDSGSLSVKTSGLFSSTAESIAAFLLLGIFGTTKTETSASSEEISKQWTKTKSDKSRFAVGIRDIDIYSHVFDSKSEVISKQFTSPKPISKVTLSVSEYIPEEFYTNDYEGEENNWIKYYISADNGSTWYRISPTEHKTTLSEDGVNNVPSLININSDVASSDRENPLAYIDLSNSVYTIRFRATFERPGDISDADSYTPILYSYALTIYPLGGL